VPAPSFTGFFAGSGCRVPQTSILRLGLSFMREGRALARLLRTLKARHFFTYSERENRVYFLQL